MRSITPNTSLPDINGCQGGQSVQSRGSVSLYGHCFAMLTFRDVFVIMVMRHPDTSPNIPFGMSGLQIEDLSVKGGAAYQGIWGW